MTIYRSLVLNIEIDILVNIHVIQSLMILAQRNQLIDMLSRIVRTKMVPVLLEDLGLGLLTTPLMSQWCLNDLLGENGAVLESDGQGVGDGALLRVMVIPGELGILDAGDALAEGFDELRGCGLGFVGVVGGLQAVEDEHGGDHVLDAVITVSEVLHGLELLVDDADAGLVGSVDDALDVLGGLAHLPELDVDALGRLNGGLRVELSCNEWISCVYEQVGGGYSPGQETLKSTFSMT